MALIDNAKPNTYCYERTGRNGPIKVPYVEFKRIKKYRAPDYSLTDGVEIFRVPVDGCHGVNCEGVYTALEQFKRQGCVVVGGGDWRLGQKTGDEGLKAWVERETRQIDPRLIENPSVVDQRVEVKKNAKA